MKLQQKIPTLVAVAMAAALLTPALTARAAESPNIVVILADDLGYGDLSSYGASDMRTPHIGALVTKGMRFDGFYANCPVCSPTRASLLTGCYPELVGVPGVIRTHDQNSWGYLAKDATLLPEVLAPRGYTSAIVGKWHLGLEAPNRPTERGFDFFHGFLGDMMDDYYTHRRHGINYMRRNLEEIDPEGHATDLFTLWACQYIERAARGDQPFLLYLAYNAPHTPIQPPKQWVDRVKRREPQMEEKRARLVALIEHMDDGIGQVVKTLHRVGVADETLVFFTSDNGGQLNVGADNGPLRDGKQSMYEGGLRVPACAVWPGRIAAGSQGAGHWMSMDIFATICELTGAETPEGIDGVSFLPTLLGKSQQVPERHLFFHRREGGARYQGLTIAAVRRDDWKLVRNSPFAPMELFNLREDPREEQDVAGEHRGVFRELADALRRQVQRGGAVPWQAR